VRANTWTPGLPVHDRRVGRNSWVAKATIGATVYRTTSRLDRRAGYKKMGVRYGRVPAYIRTTSKAEVVWLSSVEEADYFYVGLIEDCYTGPTSVSLSGTAHVGDSLRISETLSAVYASYDNYLVGLPRAAMTHYTLATADVRCIDYEEPNSAYTLAATLGADEVSATHAEACELESLRKVMLRSYRRTKVTADHHVHYTPAEVACTALSVRKGEVSVLTKLSQQSGITEAAMSGFGLWLGTLTATELCFVASMRCWEVSDSSKAHSALKKAVRGCKLLQNNMPMDLLSLFEAEVLYNRGMGKLDWGEEKRNRVKPDTVNITEEEVFGAAVRILADGRSERSGEFRSIGWAEYWKMRWQSTPNGSLKSQYPEDLEGMPTDYRLRNKFVGLCTTGEKTLDDWTSREPSLHAWTSVKYEWGKERAIYGCDLTNFVITNFAMYECEERLPYNFPIGRRANETYVRALLERTLAGSEAFCFDFEDFNSQHSKGAMRAVLKAYNQVYRDVMSVDQRQAMDWVIEAIERLVVHDNEGTNSTYEAEGTLFSGWRLTTFLNSVLNAVYVELIKGKDKIYSAHNGDDVILGVKSMRQATTMLDNAKRLNVRAQPAKCALAGAAEFLRVDRQAEGSGQYLARAISTLVHSRIESQPATLVSDAVSANETRLGEFVDRGGNQDRAIALRSVYLRRVMPLFDNTYADGINLLRTSTVNGGLCVSRRASVALEVATSKADQRIGSLKDVTLPKTSSRSWHGIKDFADMLVQRLTRQADQPVDVEQVSKRLTEATRKALALERKPIKLVPTSKIERAGLWRELAGLLKHLRKNNTLGVARLAGIRLDLINTDREELELLAIKLGQSAEPMKVLSVLV
jgi:hypothetical protein